MESNLKKGKWGDLNTDCLVEIFAKADTKTLARSILLVCKSWNHASADPRCWQTLVFSESCWSASKPHRWFGSNKFIKFAIGRSQGLATSVEFPIIVTGLRFTSKTYISEGCPNLKVLDMSMLSYPEFRNLDFGDIFSKLKKLEVIKLAKVHYKNMLQPISVHCKNLVGLDINGSDFRHEDVSDIVHFAPKIKYLKLKPGLIWRRELMTILMNCRELEELHVSCASFYPDKDEEILKLSSRIKIFKFNVSFRIYSGS